MSGRMSREHHITSGRELRFQPRKTFMGNAGRLPRQVMQMGGRWQKSAIALVGVSFCGSQFLLA